MVTISLPDYMKNKIGNNCNEESCPFEDDGDGGYGWHCNLQAHFDPERDKKLTEWVRKSLKSRLKLNSSGDYPYFNRCPLKDIKEDLEK